jgi:hypothetical protein
MTARGSLGERVVPVVFGIACLAAFLALIEVLINVGMINRFIVPLPSEIARSFG